ncbi:MAG: hypothetical protein ACTSYG_10475 [Candidatus Heimdallarchaeota archaeon]
MDIIKQIKDEIRNSKNKETFKTFDELYKYFPGGQPDHFRPVRPVNLERMHKEVEKSGIEDFQKGLGEGGVWFKMR